MNRRGSRAAPAVLALAATLAVPACSGALFTQIRYDRGHAPSAAAVDAAVARAATKAAVLQRWGPPVETLPQPDGDVWVYRRTTTDLDVVNLNTSILTGVLVPLYADVDGVQSDQLLWVFFDRSGRVRDVGRRRLR